MYSDPTALCTGVQPVGRCFGHLAAVPAALTKTIDDLIPCPNQLATSSSMCCSVSNRTLQPEAPSEHQRDTGVFAHAVASAQPTILWKLEQFNEANLRHWYTATN